MALVWQSKSISFQHSSVKSLYQEGFFFVGMSLTEMNVSLHVTTMVLLAFYMVSDTIVVCFPPVQPALWRWGISGSGISFAEFTPWSLMTFYPKRDTEKVPNAQSVWGDNRFCQLLKCFLRNCETSMICFPHVKPLKGNSSKTFFSLKCTFYKYK